MPKMWIDGGSRGNPGPSAAAAYIEWDYGQVIMRSWFLGERTNNEAEYLALIYGMSTALNYGAEELKVRCDSKLVVKQMQGEWSAKTPHITMMLDEAFRIAMQFDDFDIKLIPRERNITADGLVNERLDAVMYG